MESLFNILSRRDPDPPPQIAAIKQYIRDEFDGAEVEVTVREKMIIVATPSASLANSLRLHGPTIRRRANLDKKLVFRVGL